MPRLATFVQVSFAVPVDCASRLDGWTTVAATCDLEEARGHAARAYTSLEHPQGYRVARVRVLPESELLVDEGAAGVAAAYTSLRHFAGASAAADAAGRPGT